MFQRPRGTRDFSPAEMCRRLALEKLCDEQAARYGFMRVATPTFESLDLFTAKSGDAIEGELYAFEDKGGRPLTLRPELTAPVMRMVANEMRQTPKPMRLSYFGNCFRYEEFKTGRYREFWQYGCEIIGATGPLVEAELVAFGVSLMRAAGVEDWSLRIGHVGILNDLLAGLNIADDARRDVMRLLDKGDFKGLKDKVDSDSAAALEAFASLSGGDDVVSKAREMLEGMDIATASLDALAEMLCTLAGLVPDMPPMSIDLTVARGLDYYTGMVFEFEVPELKGEAQVLGGGSYQLMQLFDLPDLDPCCGFGLGFDRILLALEKQAERLGREEVVPGESSGPGSLAVIPFKIDANNVVALVAGLRDAGERVLLELRERNLGRSMGWADSAGAAFALIIGPRDLESGQATIKRLADGEQIQCALEVEAVSAALATLRN
ncbi:MAG: histidine--tRNA ligase [Candidatus Thermoplasmatota archaeon]|nr:histidine--tRNA ligase [Candidatus Thermoplasmatota archaeon]